MPGAKSCIYRSFWVVLNFILQRSAIAVSFYDGFSSQLEFSYFWGFIWLLSFYFKCFGFPFARCFLLWLNTILCHLARKPRFSALYFLLPILSVSYCGSFGICRFLTNFLQNIKISSNSLIYNSSYFTFLLKAKKSYFACKCDQLVCNKCQIKVEF